MDKTKVFLEAFDKYLVNRDLDAFIKKLRHLEKRLLSQYFTLLVPEALKEVIYVQSFKLFEFLFNELNLDLHFGNGFIPILGKQLLINFEEPTPEQIALLYVYLKKKGLNLDTELDIKAIILDDLLRHQNSDLREVRETAYLIAAVLLANGMTLDNYTKIRCKFSSSIYRLFKRAYRELDTAIKAVEEAEGTIEEKLNDLSKILSTKESDNIEKSKKDESSNKESKEIAEFKKRFKGEVFEDIIGKKFIGVQTNSRIKIYRIEKDALKKVYETKRNGFSLVNLGIFSKELSDYDDKIVVMKEDIEKRNKAPRYKFKHLDIKGKSGIKYLSSNKFKEFKERFKQKFMIYVRRAIEREFSYLKDYFRLVR